MDIVSSFQRMAVSRKKRQEKRKQKDIGTHVSIVLLANITDSPMLRNGDSINLSMLFKSEF
jgi:hypothetical protein